MFKTDFSSHWKSLSSVTNLRLYVSFPLSNDLHTTFSSRVNRSGEGEVSKGWGGDGCIRLRRRRGKEGLEWPVHPGGRYPDGRCPYTIRWARETSEILRGSHRRRKDPRLSSCTVESRYLVSGGEDSSSQLLVGWTEPSVRSTQWGRVTVNVSNL